MSLQQVLGMVRNVLTLVIPQLKSADSVVGIKETKEAMVAANEISLFLISRFKDGVDLADGFAIVKKLVTDEDPAFKKIIDDGYNGIKLIPAEFEDIDAGEGLELADVQISMVPRFIDALKKEEPVA